MVSTLTVAVLVLAGIVALTAPLLYITYLSHADDSHSPGGGRTDPEPAD